MHPIENIMQTSMEQIKRMVDVNTVVGNPIVTAGNTMILPVSKLSLAFLVGGGEYGHMCSAKKAADEANRDSRFPFAGTSAVGMCITPLAFITEEQGNVRVMPADRKSSTDRLVDMVPQVLKCVEKLINTGIDCINKKCACADSEKKRNQKQIRIAAAAVPTGTAPRIRATEFQIQVQAETVPAAAVPAEPRLRYETAHDPVSSAQHCADCLQCSSVIRIRNCAGSS